MDARPNVETDRDGSIGWIRLNRPERLNAFDTGMREALDAALEEMEAEPGVQCIIITGVGRAFSTGGDVSVMAGLLERGDADEFERLVRVGNRIVHRIHTMDKPVIAAINGAAVGAGASLALACDLRIASETATIGFTFMRVGLHPDWGATYFLPRLVGPAIATELLLTGGMTSAERAERMGLVHRVVPPGELLAAAKALAGQVVAQPRALVQSAKRVLRESLQSSLDAVLAKELEAQVAAFRSPDFREGIAAFLEKRAPVFRGG
ncbi:MAG TPA: enoyl-CoA hydratase [Longimicrobiales bacterium]|nr:enoyl-CoA hydratase [Longimicrobiales bacterium]